MKHLDWFVFDMPYPLVVTYEYDDILHVGKKYTGVNATKPSFSSFFWNFAAKIESLLHDEKIYYYKMTQLNCKNGKMKILDISSIFFKRY